MFSGIILTGGRSVRMGTDKAFLVPGDGGAPMVQRAHRALIDAGARECLAIGGDLDRLAALGIAGYPDDVPDQGPLAGIVAGLRAASSERCVVLTCDLPSIDAATVTLLDKLLAGSPGTDCVIPVVGGRRQVLTAAYRRSAVDVLASVLASGQRSVRGALATLAVLEVGDVDPVRFVDLDRPADVDHYARTVPPAPKEDDVDVPEIDVAALAELHPQGITLIDVRNPDEYDEAHVPGATLIPLPEIADRADEVPSDTPVYVICAMGGRSRKACEYLAAQGRDVTNIDGGTKGWIEAGHAVDTGSAS